MGNETVFNNFQTTLALNYVSGSGTASLTSATGLPASSAATYTLGVFSASDPTAAPIVLLRVSSRSGTTVNVTAEGTDTNAPSGSVVVNVESALAITTYVSQNASGSPGGSSGQTQYNNSGSFGGYTMSGDATINTGSGALTLSNSGVSANTYGDATHVAQVAVDAKGRVTSASNVAITFAGPGGSSGQIQYNNSSAFGGFTASGDATINTATGVVTLANSGATAATYGDSTHVPQIAVDAKGRITSASNVSISASAGALVLLEQHTASASASLDFTTCITSSYDDYMIEFVNIVPGTTAQDFLMRMSTNGGSSYDSGTNYRTVGWYNGLGDTLTGYAVSGQTAIHIANSLSTTSNFSMSGRQTLYNPGSAVYKMNTGQVASVAQGDLYQWALAGIYVVTTAVNAFQFLFASGNIASGTIRVYGIAKT